MQKFETSFGKELSGKTLTFSLLTSEGLYTGSAAFPIEAAPDSVGVISNDTTTMYFEWNDGSGGYPAVVFVLKKAGVMYTAAKLELGSQQTLAHQDTNGNWVLNDPPPNRALELLKCQRYFVRIGINRYRMSAFIGGNKRTVFHIPLPCCMRAIPSITCYDSSDGGVLWIRNANNSNIQGMVPLSQLTYGVDSTDSSSVNGGVAIWFASPVALSDAQLLVCGYIDFDANL